MKKLFKKSSHKTSSSVIGLPPGTLVHIGERKTKNVRISIINYTQESYSEEQTEDMDVCFSYLRSPGVTWINVDGLHEPKVMEELGRNLSLHHLMLEDILNTWQRPKAEDYESYLFFVLKMLSYKDEEESIESEQVSLVLGRNYVLSFQERQGDVFDPIRERIKTNRGRIRKMGADYLAYSLIDAVVDSYFIILERFGQKLEDLEEELLVRPTSETSWKIHTTKRELISLRKSVWPLRELINTMQRVEGELIKKTTLIYLRDVYDHTIQVIDSTESFRDIVTGMLDTYLTSISNKMNSIMKVLTLIATIFIPLTFLAGIYGMNFEYMPELEWKWSYPIVWAVMVATALSLVWFFKRKRWLKE
ncbi:MAG: magnesium/cobalt transporter CorA [Spirochaetota bacterium]